MHWVKSSRKGETYQDFIHRIYKDKLRNDIQLAVEISMPKHLKLLDKDGVEIKHSLPRDGNTLLAHLHIEFDQGEEAQDFVMAVRNDPLKLCKAIVDLFSEQKMLEGYEPRHKPRIKLVEPETTVEKPGPSS